MPVFEYLIVYQYLFKYFISQTIIVWIWPNKTSIPTFKFNAWVSTYNPVMFKLPYTFIYLPYVLTYMFKTHLRTEHLEDLSVDGMKM